MQIFVKKPSGKTITIDVEPHFTIDNVKACLYYTEKMPTSQQRLLLSSRIHCKDWLASDLSLGAEMWAFPPSFPLRTSQAWGGAWRRRKTSRLERW